jgi:glycine/D-amino acid oxidase-like deaminating enzyme
MTGDVFDIAIVGGGLVGSAIAFGLRDMGPRVALLDEGDVALRASRGNFGLIWVQGKGTGLSAYGNWTQHSAREWPRLAAEIAQASGIDVALRQPGGLHVCLTPHELDARVARLDATLAQPGFERYAIEVLDRAGVASRLPGCGPGVVGGTWSSLDGDCNPLRLLRGLHGACSAAGVRHMPAHAVQRIGYHDARFDLVTEHGSVAAKRIVLAAGLANARLAPMVGLTAPVKPNKGQIVVLERTQAFLPFPLETIRQTDEGTIMLGDSQEDAGFDESLEPGVLGTIAQRALDVLPALRDVRVNRCWAALRVVTPDGFPIYAQSMAHPGAFVATCHSGVTLAAAHAYSLAPAIRAEALPSSFAPFSATRFDARDKRSLQCSSDSLT